MGKCKDIRTLASQLGEHAEAWYISLLDKQDQLRAAGRQVEATQEEDVDDPDDTILDYVPLP